MKKITNIIILFTITMLCALPTFGQVAGKTEIEELSVKFLESRIESAGYERPCLQVDTMISLSRKNKSLMNIINFKNGGWVITPADKRFYPILAYSFTGCFDFENIPDNCRGWIDAYVSQMAAAIDSDGPFKPGMPQVWAAIEKRKFSGGSIKSVSPLLNSVWDQLGYHNHKCPADPDALNGYTPVGCVPLAMAQLMYYYRFPEAGAGSASYTPSYQIGVYGEQFADFENTVYRWDDMTDICREKNDAIATLCYHAGVSVEVNYMPESSGTNVNRVSNALTGHFKYLADDYLPRADVTGTWEWTELLMQNLDNRQPVIYRSTAGFGGHVYVCDGYQDSTHFHFNWGWGGAYNGYFYIDDLTPGGIQINYSQGAVLNIYPDTTQYEYPEPQLFTLLENNVGSFEDGSGPEDYPDGYSASWLIQPSDTSITNIMLEFTMTDTESGYDLIKVYDGPDTLSPPVRIFSGQILPEKFHSASPQILVTFHANQQNTGNGFHANYYGYHLPFCGETKVITDPTGVLEDGSRYHKYRNNADCSWLIAPELSPDDSISNVIVFVPVFDLASGDTLLFYDGQSNASDLLGIFWNGNAPSQLVSEGNKVFVEFKTDAADEAQGWALYWDYVLPEYCNDTLVFDEFEGTISDGSGEKNYVENSDCYFLIDVPEAENISLEFLNFNFEDNYDYLNIFDPAQPDVPLVKLSGQELPPDLSWSLEKLLIHFHSDYAGNYQGFELNYAASISGVPELAKKVIITPNPVVNQLTIHSETLALNEAEIHIYRLDGQAVYAGILKSQSQTIDLNRLPPGIYMINVQFEDWAITKKMIKN